MFVDGVGSDGEGEVFNSEDCQWEAEEEEDVQEEEERAAAYEPPPASKVAVIPEKVFSIIPLSNKPYTISV